MSTAFATPRRGSARAATRPSGSAETARTRREQRRLETRELLYQLAIAELHRVGTSRARVRDIADAAGVVPGTFYFHFPTLDHVVFEFWQRNSRRFVTRLRELVPDGDRADVARFLRAVGDAMVDVEAEVGDAALVRDSIALVLRPPERVDLRRNPIAELVVGFFARAAERGAIASELRPEELASVLLTSILGALAAASDDPAERRQGLRRTIDFFLRALAPRAGSDSRSRSMR